VRFERTVEVAAAVERVLAELSEPARFLGLQPLLFEVREEPAPPGRRAFAAVERIAIAGPLAWRNRIHVELAPDPAARTVAFATRAPLGIALAGAFRVEPCAAGARVVESVSLRCPRALRRFVLPRAIAAQESLLANLRARLAAE
jgi:hypothetical protein